MGNNIRSSSDKPTLTLASFTLARTSLRLMVPSGSVSNESAQKGKGKDGPLNIPPSHRGNRMGRCLD